MIAFLALLAIFGFGFISGHAFTLIWDEMHPSPSQERAIQLYGCVKRLIKRLEEISRFVDGENVTIRAELELHIPDHIPVRVKLEKM